jgi:uncharacterized protein YdaU (DUF1376 family)
MNDKPRMPYFKTFPSDELLDYRVSQLTLDEFGAFQKLKMFVWKEEKLPLDFKILGKLLGISAKKFEKLWKTLNLLFDVEGEEEQFIRHSELDEQRRNYSDFLEKSRRGGIKSAELRGKAGSSNLPTSVEAKETKETKEKQNIAITHTDAPALQSAKAGSVNVPPLEQSRFNYAERLEFFEACKAGGQGIESTSALAIARRDGKSDVEIQNFFDAGKKLPEVRGKKLSPYERSLLAIESVRQKMCENEATLPKNIR